MVFLKKTCHSKASDPFNIVSEMLKVPLDRNNEKIARLMNAIFKENKVPSDWHDSYIASLFKGKGSANVRGNYEGLKLAEHHLKVTERVIKSISKS